MNAALRPPSPAAIVLFTLVGLGLRAFHMNAQSLWFDEIGSVQIATTPVPALLAAIESANGVEPTAWLSTAYYALAKADARSLATALAAETAPDDLVVVNAAYMASAVAYYYRAVMRSRTHRAQRRAYDQTKDIS